MFNIHFAEAYCVSLNIKTYLPKIYNKPLCNVYRKLKFKCLNKKITYGLSKNHFIKLKKKNKAKHLGWKWHGMITFEWINLFS